MISIIIEVVQRYYRTSREQYCVCAVFTAAKTWFYAKRNTAACVENGSIESPSRSAAMDGGKDVMVGEISRSWPVSLGTDLYSYWPVSSYEQTIIR